MGVNRRPWLYTERYYENLVTAAPADITPEQDLLAFDQLHFALASRIEPDGQGRLLLPQKILKRSGIQKEVTLIGVRDHLEVWNRADWDARIEELERQASEIAVAAKRQRQQQDPERPAKPA
jgi:MraZ protein